MAPKTTPSVATVILYLVRIYDMLFVSEMSLHMMPCIVENSNLPQRVYKYGHHIARALFYTVPDVFIYFVMSHLPGKQASTKQRQQEPSNTNNTQFSTAN